MGIADLRGPFAKLGWAKKHAETFDKEFERFTAAYAESFEAQLGYEDGWYTLFVTPPSAIPQQFALIAGDCLTNLRAALDHLVWQLALREDQEATNEHAFLICETPEQFKKRVINSGRGGKGGGPLRGIPIGGDAWVLIRRAQPFQCAKPKSHPLSVLNQLVNIDKHRTLLVQRSFVTREELLRRIRWKSDVQSIELISLDVPLSHEHPTKIARFRFPCSNILEVKERMSMDGELAMLPKIGDKETQWELPIFGKMIRTVEKVLKQCSALPRVQA